MDSDSDNMKYSQYKESGIFINSRCLETSPCQHDIIINGEKTRMRGDKITELLYSVSFRKGDNFQLDYRGISHFEQYMPELIIGLEYNEIFNNLLQTIQPISLKELFNEFLILHLNKYGNINFRSASICQITKILVNYIKTSQNLYKEFADHENFIKKESQNVYGRIDKTMKKNVSLGICYDLYKQYYRYITSKLLPYIYDISIDLFKDVHSLYSTSDIVETKRTDILEYYIAHEEESKSNHIYDHIISKLNIQKNHIQVIDMYLLKYLNNKYSQDQKINE